jgi:hypothetical protein
MSSDLQRFLSSLCQDLPRAPSNDLCSIQSGETEGEISIVVDNARFGSFSLASPGSPFADSTRNSDGPNNQPPHRSPVQLTSRGKRRKIRTLYVREGNASFLISPLQSSISDFGISHTASAERFSTGSPKVVSAQIGDRLPTLPLRCNDSLRSSNSDEAPWAEILALMDKPILDASPESPTICTGIDRAIKDGGLEGASAGKQDRAPVVPRRAMSTTSSCRDSDMTRFD